MRYDIRFGRRYHATLRNSHMMGRRVCGMCMANETSKCAANQILQGSKFGQQHKTKTLLKDVSCRALIDANGFIVAAMARLQAGKTSCSHL